MKTFQNASICFAVCPRVGNSTRCHNCRNLLWWIKRVAFRLKPCYIWISGHIYSFSYLESLSRWCLRSEVFMCGFGFSFLGFFFPLHINLQWVSLLWEGTEALQSLSGLAAIHPKPWAPPRHVQGSAVNPTRPGKGQAGRSHFIPWKCCCKLFLLVILIIKKCRVMLTENLY